MIKLYIYYLHQLRVQQLQYTSLKIHGHNLCPSQKLKYVDNLLSNSKEIYQKLGVLDLLAVAFLNQEVVGRKEYLNQLNLNGKIFQLGGFEELAHFLRQADGYYRAGLIRHNDICPRTGLTDRAASRIQDLVQGEQPAPTELNTYFSGPLYGLAALNTDLLEIGGADLLLDGANGGSTSRALLSYVSTKRLLDSKELLLALDSRAIAPESLSKANFLKDSAILVDGLKIFAMRELKDEESTDNVGIPLFFPALTYPTQKSNGGAGVEDAAGVPRRSRGWAEKEFRDNFLMGNSYLHALRNASDEVLGANESLSVSAAIIVAAEKHMVSYSCSSRFEDRLLQHLLSQAGIAVSHPAWYKPLTENVQRCTTAPPEGTAEGVPFGPNNLFQLSRNWSIITPIIGAILGVSTDVPLLCLDVAQYLYEPLSAVALNLNPLIQIFPKEKLISICRFFYSVDHVNDEHRVNFFNIKEPPLEQFAERVNWDLISGNPSYVPMSSSEEDQETQNEVQEDLLSSSSGEEEESLSKKRKREEIGEEGRRSKRHKSDIRIEPALQLFRQIYANITLSDWF